MRRLCMHMPVLCVLIVAMTTEICISCASENNGEIVYTYLVNKTKVEKDFNIGPLVLNLTHNNLTNITNDIIDVIPWLTTLDLSHNRITHLHQDVFKNATCLLRLYLRYNNIVHLPSGLLGSLGRQMKINVFDVSHNNITTVGLDVFHGDLNNLKIVNLSYNNLEYFEPWPYTLYSLTRTSHCSFGHVYCIFDLSHNKINECRNTNRTKISRLSDHRVDVSSNNISDIMKCVNTLTHLNSSIINLYMDFRDNPIICDCNIYELVKIFKKTLLANLTDAIFTCHNPQHLKNKTFGDIRKNPAVLQCKVTEMCPLACSCVYTPSENRATVDCSMVNTFNELPMILPAYENILLNMSGNKLVTLTSRSYIPHLIIVDVSFNQIVSIDVNFFRYAKRMRYLNISHNLITTLPTTIRNLDFSRVRLENNTLKCSCESRWMKNWMQSVNSGAMHQHPLQCDLSGSRQNVTIAFSNLKCGNTNTIIIIVCSVLGILVTASIITVFMACVWKYETNVLTYYMCGIRPFKAEEKETLHQDKEFPYDMYIAFDKSNKDVINWINNVLLPWCEKQKKPVVSYYGIRDDPIGDIIPDLMTQTLTDSRKILFIVGENYGKDGWSLDLTNMAHSSHYDKMIILLFDCPKNLDNIESEQIKSHVSQKRHIKLGETLFWPKLYYRIWK